MPTITLSFAERTEEKTLDIDSLLKLAQRKMAFLHTIYGVCVSSVRAKRRMISSKSKLTETDSNFAFTLCSINLIRFQSLNIDVRVCVCVMPSAHRIYSR